MTTKLLGDFSLQAEAYARARPGYPSAMLPLLQALTNVTAGDPVTEIGAGTGLFTRILAHQGLRVAAVEPNAEMSSKAPPLEGVEWHDGTFEETGLESASQAWAVAAQSFHWADVPKALPEIHRVLAPGRCLTVLWNNRNVEKSPVLSWTREIIRDLVPGFDETYRQRDWWTELTSTGHFQNPIELAIPHQVTMDRERYMNLWRSHHLLSTAAGPEGLAEILRRIEERLGQTTQVNVPYTCRIWTVTASSEI